MTKGKDLYRLQCLDSERDAKQHRLREVEAALGESEALQRARRALKSAEKEARRLELQQRDQELENDGLSNRISRSEQRLYSGKVNNPKELADLQAEVASLKRRQQKLEDALLRTMIEREEAEETRAQARAHLDETKSRWSAQQANLTTEREELQARLAEIEQKRAELRPSIEAGDLSTYQALRSRKGGRVVVQVRDGACSGCGVAISPSVEWELRQRELVHCDNCGRLIVQT